MVETILTRRELYDLVWSTPMTKLAGRFGMSDRGFAKLCERHRVPTPPRGHWAKKEVGKKVKQAIFTATEDQAINRVLIRCSHSLPDDVQAVMDKFRTAGKEAAKPVAKLEQRTASLPHAVPSGLALHPAVRATALALRRARSSDGVGRAFGPGMCGIEVGAASIERAISILNELSHALSRAGIRVAAGGEFVEVARGEQKSNFHLKEQTRRVPHVPTVAEKARDEQWRSGLGRSTNSDTFSWYHKYDYVRRGELRIEINGGYGPMGSRTKWVDGRRGIDSLVPEIANALALYFDLCELERQKAAEKSRHLGELEVRRKLAVKRKERENARYAFVDGLIILHQKATRMRSWLSNAEANFADRSLPDTARMMIWVREHLAHLEAQLTPEAVESAARAAALFPELALDELIDPLGEPHPRGLLW